MRNEGITIKLQIWLFWQNLGFSHSWPWGLLFSMVWYYAIWQIYTNISGEHDSSIFRPPLVLPSTVRGNRKILSNPSTVSKNKNYSVYHIIFIVKIHLYNNKNDVLNRIILIPWSNNTSGWTVLNIHCLLARTRNMNDTAAIDVGIAWNLPGFSVKMYTAYLQWNMSKITPDFHTLALTFY